MGTFTKWKGYELLGNLGMSVYARTAAKRQEGCVKRKGTGDDLPHSKQLDWEADFGKAVPQWIRSGTSSRKNRGGRKGVAFQKKEEITTTIIGPHKDKQ